MIVTTKRLLLRQFKPGDADDLAPILGDPEVMRFGPDPLALEEIRMWIGRARRSYAEEGFGMWAIVAKPDGPLAGFCGLCIQQVNTNREVELGYRLARAYWGQGLATEAATAVRDYAFGTLRLNRMISIIESANTASVRVVEKVGLKWEKETVAFEKAVQIYALSNHR